MKKDKIMQIIKDNFSYVYCNSCKYAGDEDVCKGCITDPVYWCVSDKYAEMVARKIIGTDDERSRQ